MSLEYAILGFLSEGDRSGYDLKTRCFDGEASHFWTADQAQVYRTLDRLERTKLVSAKSVHQDGKPDRRVYRLTSGGRAMLSEWLSAARDSPPRRDPFLVQLRFAESAGDDALIEMLEATRADRQRQLDALRTRRAERSRVRRTPTRRDTFTRMTLDAALAALRSEIDQLDDFIDQVRAQSLAREADPAPQRRLFGTQGEPGGAQ